MTSGPPASTAGPDRATIAAFVGVVILGGLNAIAVKQSVRELDPFWSAGLRFLAAGVILAGFMAVTGRAVPRGRSFGGAAIYGLIGFAGSFGFAYPALREVPAGTAILFLSLVPLMTLGFAVAHGQERFRIQGLAGALLAVAGVAVVVADQLSADVPLVPMLMMLAAAAFIAEGAVILKWVPRADPFATNAVAMLAGGIALAVLSLIGGETFAIPGQVETWLATGYLVLFGSIALFGLYLFALRRWTASAVSYTTLLMPLVTIPVAAVLLSETVSTSFVAGGAIALAGVYVGAFLRFGPRQVVPPASAECLPIDNCGPELPTRHQAATPPS
jgi:drug/metabolite transporter (DMT)-like permease